MSQVRYLSIVGRDPYDMFGVPLVEDPGLWFQLMATLTLVAGASVVWLLADWVTRSGLCAGAVLFGATAYLFSNLSWLTTGPLDAPPSAAAPLALLAVSWPVLLFALWRFNPRFPLSLGRASLRSPLDVVLVPGALAALLLRSSLPGVASLAASVLVVAASGAIVFFLFRARTSEGRNVGLLIAGVLVPLPVLAMCALPVSARLVEQSRPGPFAGTAQLTATLRCEDAPADAAERDAALLRQRLEALKLDGTVTVRGPDRLEVVLEDVRADRDPLSAILPRGRLEFRMVSKDLSSWNPEAVVAEGAPEVRVEADPYEETRVLVGERRALSAALDRALAREVRNNVLLECSSESGAERCRARLLEPSTTNRNHVAEASVTVSAFDGRPEINLTFDTEGAEWFATLTRQGVGRNLAIVVDDEITSSPRISEEIRGGMARITLGTRGDQTREAEAEEAERLATRLQTGALLCTWLKESVR